MLNDYLKSKPVPLSWFTKSTFRYTPLILELMVISVAIRLLGLVQPFVYQALIDRVLPFQREATLDIIVVMLVATNITSSLLSAVARYLETHMGNRLIAEIAKRLFDHVLNLPLNVLQKWRVGEALSRIGDVDAARNFLTGTLAKLVLDLLFAFIYLGALYSISPFLMFIVLIALPMEIGLSAAFGPFLRRRMQASFLAGSAHQSRVVEGLSNIVSVKAMASESAHAKRFGLTLSESLAAKFMLTKFSIAENFAGNMLMADVLIIYFGAKEVFAGSLTLGALIAFDMVSSKVYGPILSLSSLWENWQGLIVARSRLGDLLNTPAETDNRRPQFATAGSVILDVKKVSFRYQDDRPVIENLSLSIDALRLTLIVGSSGCGKSTLGKLLSGLYVPDSGTIEINGNPVSGYDPQSVRRAIAYMPQEPALFCGTILENLKLAKADASSEEIEKALSSAACDGFIAGLPYGVNTNVGERGTSLSGGQRQRISLACALLTNPVAMVLDEPTSALDDNSTVIVVETIKRLSDKMTLIVVTHKRSLFGKDVNVIDLGAIDDERCR